jgi:hypothetical protein
MKWTRSLRTGAVAFVAALATVGCIKSDQKIAIAADGSGTLVLTATFDSSKMAELKAMFDAIGGGPGGPAPAPTPTPAPTTPGDGAGMAEPAMGDAPKPEEKKKDENGFAKHMSKEEVEKQLKKTEGNTLTAHSLESKDGKETVHMEIAFTISETNGIKAEDGAKANWVVDWKALTGADKTKKDAAVMKLTFKGEGLDWKPFSYKPDPQAAAAEFGFGR